VTTADDTAGDRIDDRVDDRVDDMVDDVGRADGPRADIGEPSVIDLDAFPSGARGALEAVLTILAVHHRTVPATINLDNQDPEIPLNVVTGEHLTLPKGDVAALNNSFGFGGHNVALAIRSAS